MRHVYSASQVVDSNTCVWRWWLRNCLEFREKVPDSRPMLGKFIHAGIAMHISGGDYEKMILAEYNKEVQRLKLIEDMFDPESVFDELERTCITAQGVTEMFIDRFPWDEWETVKDPQGAPMVEYAITFETQAGDTFVMIVDWVARRISDGTIWVIDWKTKKSIDNPETDAAFVTDDTNVQKALYQYGLERILGMETEGTSIVQIRNFLPKIPKQNKNGTTARNDITTDWETYSRTVVDHGGNPVDYADMMEKLGKHLFLAQHFTYRAKQTYNAIWFKIAYPRMVMLNTLRALKLETEPHRSFGSFSCNGCWAREACLQSLNGVPYDEIHGYERSKDVRTRHDASRGEVAFEFSLGGEEGDPA